MLCFRLNIFLSGIKLYKQMKNINNYTITFLQIIALFLVYYVVGTMSLYLAIPPEYTTVFYPASGIAMATIYFYGYRLLPGVFLGAALLELSIYLPKDFENVDLQLFINVLSLGIGATLQSFVGAYLLRRIIGKNTRLEQASKIIKFILIGSFLSCLIFSTWGATTLFLTSTISFDNILFTWWTWYVGDTLGIIVFAPLLVVLLNPDIIMRRKIAVCLPLITIFTLVIIFFTFINIWEKDQNLNEFDKKAYAIEKTVHQSFQSQLEKLYAIRSLYAASKDVSRDEFSAFVKRAFEGHTVIQALEWVPLVSQEQKENYINKARQEGIANFDIFKETSDNKVIRASDRDYYYPVYFAELYKGNEEVLGFDLGSDPKRLSALTRARDTGLPIATARIRLIQKKEEDQYGFLIFLPIYKNNMPTDTVDARRTALEGFAVGVYHLRDIFEPIIEEWRKDGIYLHIIDKSDDVALTLYTSTNQQSDAAKAYEEKSFAYYWEYDVEFASRSWSIQIYGLEESILVNVNWAIWFALGIGLLFTGFLGIFLLLITGQTAQIKKTIEERTIALKNSEDRTKLILESVEEGIYGVDLKGNITFANKAAENMLGYTFDEMKNASQHELIHHSHPDGSPYIKEECNIYAALKDGKTHTEDKEFFWRKDGTALPVEYTSTPVRHEDREVVGAVVVFRDITDRKEAEEELKDANIELEEFAYRTSHDLRSPISSSIGLLDLAEQSMNDKDYQNALISIAHTRKSLQKLDVLIEDILALTEVKNKEEQEQEIDVTALVNSVLERIDHMDGYKNLDIKKHLKFNRPLITKKLRLNMVLENLVSNAIKYQDTEKENPYIEISTYKKNGCFVMEVKDNGLGIPKEHQEDMFMMFKRFHPKIAFGSGLGLYLMKKSADILNGDISFYDHGDGSTFTLKIPGV